MTWGKLPNLPEEGRQREAQTGLLCFACGGRSENILGSQDTEDCEWHAVSESHQEGDSAAAGTVTDLGGTAQNSQPFLGGRVAPMKSHVPGPLSFSAEWGAVGAGGGVSGRPSAGVWSAPALLSRASLPARSGPLCFRML